MLNKAGLRKGVSLIELVAIMVILGIAVGSLVLTLGGVADKSIFAERTAVATFYAQEKMEELKSKNFANITLGTSAQNVGGYNRTVTVTYCNLTGSIWGYSASETAYKRVFISVARGTDVNATLASVVSGY